MLTDLSSLAVAAYHLTGDVGAALVEAVQSGRMGVEREGAALVVAAVWGKRQNPPVQTPGLIACARLLARKERGNILVQQSLMTVAEVTADAGLREALLDVNGGIPSGAGRAFLGGFVEPTRDEPLAHQPERVDHAIAAGFTMRRAVDRIGRNDPCPCGSGKKYKKCCMDKDLERLQHSSEVAGLTQDELRADLERHLTLRRVEEMRCYEVARLDPLKVPADLHAAVIMRLALFGEFDLAVTFLEKIGYRPELGQAWESVKFSAVTAGQKEILRRLMALLSPEEQEEEKRFHFSVRLLLEEDPGRQLAMINSHVLSGLRQGGPAEMSHLVSVAYALLEGPHAPLGIALARGVIPHAHTLDACMLAEALLEARDRLELSPDDPADESLDERFSKEATANPQSSEELARAQQRIEEKSEEIRSLKQALDKLHHEVARLETPAHSPVAPPTTASPPAPTPTLPAPVAREDPGLRELRQKVEALRSALKDRHSERNQLRRELEQTRATLESLRETQDTQVAARVAGASGADTIEETEDALLLSEETIGVQPVRVTEFPRKFHEILRALPRPVARTAVVLAARLAAGEPAAFHGTKRLRVNREILRQRVGADHRLLFRLHPDTLEVVDLINRRDLERRIKTSM